MRDCRVHGYDGLGSSDRVGNTEFSQIGREVLDFVVRGRDHPDVSDLDGTSAMSCVVGAH